MFTNSKIWKHISTTTQPWLQWDDSKLTHFLDMEGRLLGETNELTTVYVQINTQV
jgi:hypothetical protein